MRASSNATMGSTTFVVELEKLADGTFKASTPTLPELPAQTGGTAREATQAMNQVVQEWVVNGCRHEST